jgi:hypothetical protein
MNHSERRQESVPRETLVISRTDDGFRVYSPANPINSFVVSGSAEEPLCTCTDFQHPSSGAYRHCNHIQAVLELNAADARGNRTPSYEQEERLAIQNENLPSQETAAAPKAMSQMLLKRSVSPDGRIDSLSVEFALPVGELPVEEIKSRASNALKIQSEIVGSFLHSKAGKTEAQTANPPEIISARMVGVAGMNTKWGRRLFINIDAGGNILKLFGNPKQLSEAIVAAGYPNLAQQVDERMELNIPCRITTKPSEDGRYLNVDQVFPSNGGRGNGRART